MSETITIKKKKKEQEEKKYLSVKEASDIIKPKYQKYQKYDKSFWDEVYEVYKQVKYGEWKYVLEETGIPHSTWGFKVKQYGYDLNYPLKGHNNFVEPILVHDEFDADGFEESTIEPEINVDVEYQSNSEQYKTVITAIKHPRILKVVDFELPERNKLIDELKITIKKLNGLLLRLESGIDD